MPGRGGPHKSKQKTPALPGFLFSCVEWISVGSVIEKWSVDRRRRGNRDVAPRADRIDSPGNECDRRPADCIGGRPCVPRAQIVGPGSQ